MIKINIKIHLLSFKAFKDKQIDVLIIELINTQTQTWPWYNPDIKA